MTVLDIKVPGEAPSPYHYANGQHPRAILVGHSPSSTAPGEVLFNCKTEERLRELLDVGRLEYLQGFDRVNLLAVEPRTCTPLTYMRTVANRIAFMAIFRHAPLVLLGREVCDVFMANLNVAIREMDGHRITVRAPSQVVLIPIPHPSPRSVFWNSELNVRLIRDALRESLPR